MQIKSVHMGNWCGIRNSRLIPALIYSTVISPRRRAVGIQITWCGCLPALSAFGKATFRVHLVRTFLGRQWGCADLLWLRMWPQLSGSKTPGERIKPALLVSRGCAERSQASFLWRDRHHQVQGSLLSTCVIPVSFPSAIWNKQEEHGDFRLWKNERCCTYNWVGASQVDEDTTSVCFVLSILIFSNSHGVSGKTHSVELCTGCPAGSAWHHAGHDFAFRTAALSASCSLGNANPCPCLLAAWLSDLVEL